MRACILLVWLKMLARYCIFLYLQIRNVYERQPIVLWKNTPIGRWHCSQPPKVVNISPHSSFIHKIWLLQLLLDPSVILLKQLFKALATKQPLLKKIENHINRQLPDLLWCHQPCQNYTKDSATQLELEVMGYSYCRLATLPIWLLEWERHLFWADLWDIVACCWKEYGLLPPPSQ